MNERNEQPSADATDRGNQQLPLRSILFAVIVSLLFYTWWWVLIVGGVCGCGLALCIVRSRRLRAFAAAFKLYLVGISASKRTHNHQEHGCIACGKPGCVRHDSHLSLDPWAGLRLHKQLDQAIEDFYNVIIENFVSTWYSKITRQPFFLDELRHQLRYASAALLRRAYKINYSKFIVDKLLPCALHHHGVWVAAQQHQQCSRDIHMSKLHSANERPHSKVAQRRYGPNATQEETKYSLDVSGVEMAALAGPLRCGLHPAVRSRAEEIRYLRCVTAAIMPYLLRKEEVHNKVFQVLIREIFAGWVLLSLTDVLADPYILNTLVVLATGDETMSTLPKNPNYRVEFLESFVRQSEGEYQRRGQLLRLDLNSVLSSQEYLYAFMQFMKHTRHFHLLQFCKDIKPFQMKILNPDLTKNEEVALFNEAWDLYVQYFDADSPNAVPFHPTIVEEMRAVLSEGAANVKKLQTSKALYQSSNYADSVLENIFIPKFLHSEEFYRLFFGPRVPTGYHKQMTKKPHEKLVASALRFGSKLKGALKTSTIDGQILDCLTNSIDISEAGVSETDAMENMNILRYLDSLAEHTKLEEHDLSNWRVELTHCDIRQADARRGGVRVFRVRACVACEEPRAWSVERSEHDFHLLRSKLTEFHGEGLLQELILPSRRDNSPPEIIRYKYEDFLQRLLQKSLLTTSQLLHIFLSAEGDFALAVQRASLGAGGSDLSNIYQSVAHRLRKEKGQHLEPFMNAFLLSSDMERYQAMKQGTSLPVEEAEEVDEVVFERVVNGGGAAAGAIGGGGRDIRNDTFGNNFDLERERRVPRVDTVYQTKLTGFTQCFMFLLSKVLKARVSVCALLGSVAALLRDYLDHGFTVLLNSVLANLLSHQRLAHLIRLGHELLFIHKPQGRQHTEEEQFERARSQLEACTPTLLALLLGPEVRVNVDSLLHMVQHPRLNKQLLYNLLDLCIAELFPELIEESAPSLNKTR